MALHHIHYLAAEEPVTLPDNVADYLYQMAPFIEEYRIKTKATFRGFIPSDYESFYTAMAYIVEHRLACGNSFCEWGSGLGVSACLASMLGFDAAGIEIDERLVTAADRFADQFGIDVEFAHGSFLPEGVDDLVDEAFTNHQGEISLFAHSDDAYEQLGRELADFDVVFAFDWPNDENLVATIFQKFACDGAILLSYHEAEGYRIRRK